MICVGAGTIPLHDALADRGVPASWFERADDALLDAADALSAPGDVILIKGSNRVFWQHDFVRRLGERLGMEGRA